MNLRWLFLAAFFSLILSCALVSCNTLSNPYYERELANVKSNCSSSAILGVWNCKTNLNSVMDQGKTMNRTFNFEAGGTGNFRMLVKQPNNSRFRPVLTELPLTWEYEGGGRWRCWFGPGRGLLKFTGQRLLADTFFMLQPGMDSVHQMDIFDRPGSNALDKMIEEKPQSEEDWIWGSKNLRTVEDKSLF